MGVLTQLRVGRQCLALGHNENADRALGQAEDAAGQAIHDLRALTLVIAGVPTPLAACSSYVDVQMQMKQACASFPLAIFQTNPPVNLELSPVVATTAIRVVQQCLANAAAHSPESPVVVTATIDSGSLLISSTNQTGNSNGAGLKLGLLIMEHRVHDVGGTFKSGTANKSFEVSCRLPIGAGQ
jgi:signal transduction histidine kinase